MWPSDNSLAHHIGRQASHLRDVSYRSALCTAQRRLPLPERGRVQQRRAERDEGDDGGVAVGSASAD